MDELVNSFVANMGNVHYSNKEYEKIFERLEERLGKHLFMRYYTYKEYGHVLGFWANGLLLLALKNDDKFVYHRFFVVGNERVEDGVKVFSSMDKLITNLGNDIDDALDLKRLPSLPKKKKVKKIAYKEDKKDDMSDIAACKKSLAYFEEYLDSINLENSRYFLGNFVNNQSDKRFSAKYLIKQMLKQSKTEENNEFLWYVIAHLALMKSY